MKHSKATYADSQNDAVSEATYLALIDALLHRLGQPFITISASEINMRRKKTRESGAFIMPHAGGAVTASSGEEAVIVQVSP